MPDHAVYAARINNAILRLQQSGLVAKLWSELQTDLLRAKRRLSGGSGALLRAPTAKQLRADDATERGLTVADTEGMFLLMGIGYAIALALLLSEMVGGFTNRCRRVGRLKRRAAAEAAETKRKADEPDVASAITTGGLMPSVVVTMMDDDDDEGTDTDAGGSARSNGVWLGGSNTLLCRRRASAESPAPAERWLSEHRRNNSCNGHRPNVAQRFVALRQRNNSLVAVRHDADAGSGLENGCGGGVGTIAERIPTPYATIEERFGERVLHDF